MSIEGLLVFLLIGEAAGWLTGVAMHRKYDIIGDILLGSLGSLAGVFLLSSLDMEANGLIASLIVAFIGGVVFVFLIRTVSKVTI